MDPPLVNEASFTASANPSSYSLAGLLSFPVTGGCGSAEESTVTEHKSGGGGKRKRDFLGDSCPGSSSKILLTSGSLVPHDSMNEPNIKTTRDPKSRDEARGLKTEADAVSRTSSKPIEDKNKPEPPKDYIHVRARRGQATDSHSLAERARREKISERMKILQDLVPGCNKVIGKALVLDEIINYIQSLQRQVEFLSMKLEAVNSRLSPTLQGFPSKDLTNVAFDANPMLCAPQTPREYTQRAQAEWLHMQVGSTFQ